MYAREPVKPLIPLALPFCHGRGRGFEPVVPTINQKIYTVYGSTKSNNQTCRVLLGVGAAQRYMSFTRLSPDALHRSTRTGAGLLRSTRCELLLDAGTFFLPTSDFFSMTLLLVEGVSPSALTHQSAIARKKAA
jgi:hypothetical protein